MSQYISRIQINGLYYWPLLYFVRHHQWLLDSFEISGEPVSLQEGGHVRFASDGCISAPQVDMV
jgi:hypothetical protein